MTAPYSWTLVVPGTATTADCPECGCTAITTPYVALHDDGVTPASWITECPCGYLRRDLP